MKFDRRRYGGEIEKLVSGWSAGYLKVAKKAAKLLLEDLEQGKSVSESTKSAITKSRLKKEVRNSLLEVLMRASMAGYGINFPSSAMRSVRKRFLSDAWLPDGMTLSERLHGNDIAMRRTIVSTIRTSMRNGEALVSAARKLYDGYGYGHVLKPAALPGYLDEIVSIARKTIPKGEMQSFRAMIGKAWRQTELLAAGGAPTRSLKTAYKQLLDAAGKANRAALEKAVFVAMEEKSRYYAERIVRTETARAYADGFLARNLDDEDAIGVRWVMSTRHPDPDICDFYAGADLYGMGAGVYPKDKLPLIPAHPHCMCHYAPVFQGEAKPGKFDPEKGDRYLRRLSESQQRALLGSEGGKSWKAGEKPWPAVLRGWRRPGDQRSRIADVIELCGKTDREEWARADILGGRYPMTIRTQMQRKHLPGTREYELQSEDLYRKSGIRQSVFLEGVNVSDIVEKYAGKGDLAFRDGDPYPRERVTADDVVGYVWSRDAEEYRPTNACKIVYSSRGVHVFPDYPKKGR